MSVRSFRNSDPPALAGIWNRCQGMPGFFGPVTYQQLEQFVFGKPCFDPRSFFVACDGDVPIAFAHASLLPTLGKDAELDPSQGMTCLIAAPQQRDRLHVVQSLLSTCERYLKGRGATQLFVGAVCPWPPFYFGLFSGFRIPAVMDPGIAEVLSRNGYRPECEYSLFRLDLNDYAAQHNAEMTQLDAQVQVSPETGVLPNWWAAACLAHHEYIDFVAREIPGSRAVARLKLRTVFPNPHSSPTVGLVSFRVTEDWRDRGLESFVLLQALEWLRTNRSGEFRGCRLVEAQISCDEPAMVDACRFHRFEESPGGITYCKTF
ncbi:GNAT family N-acetyltransferase [Thermopirellula anaerolimosa]